jgi:Holliday junction resolvasome RuvABC endonuclease subunit
VRVLAIDQSFTNCAYSIWECDKLYDFGVISSDKEQPIHLRIKFIIKELRQIIQEEQINFVVLEGLSMGGIPSVSARSLAALFYCIELLCEDEGVSFDNIPPKSVILVLGFKLPT